MPLHQSYLLACLGEFQRCALIVEDIEAHDFLHTYTAGGEL